MRRGSGRERGGEGDEEKEMGREEVRDVMRKSKDGRQWEVMGFRMRYGNMGGGGKGMDVGYL